MVSSADEFIIVEVALRQIIVDTLSATFGIDWFTKCGIDDKQLGLWQKRMDQENKARSGALLSRELFDYSQITQLRPIVEQHWELFESCFVDREKTLFYLRRLEQLRNPSMHSRQLLKFERDLVTGMCGELRNHITKYKTAKDGDYYSRIEQIVDSFGNRIPDPTMGTDSETTTRCPQIVRVGDIVNYNCTAFDPEDLEVEWQLYTIRRAAGPFYTVDPFINPVTGYNTTLEWQVSDTDVGENYVLILLRTKNVDYRANYFHDAHAIFYYQVGPPPGRRRVRLPGNS